MGWNHQLEMFIFCLTKNPWRMSMTELGFLVQRWGLQAKRFWGFSKNFPSGLEIHKRLPLGGTEVDKTREKKYLSNIGDAWISFKCVE